MSDFMKKDFDSFRKSKGINGLVMHDYQKFQNVTAGGMNMGYINPQIIEERQLNVASMDVFSRLMMDRIIFLGTGINDDVANIITAQLLYLQSNDKETPINLYINSPGGGIYAGYSVLDTMELIKPPVHTMVTGMAASMAYMLSISGSYRQCLKHSRLMQHQPMTGVSGQATDIMITATQISLLKKELYEIISAKSGQTYDKVYEDCERDYWMTSYDAKAYGVIDNIVGVD